jgi:hypothetical protein
MMIMAFWKQVATLAPGMFILHPLFFLWRLVHGLYGIKAPVTVPVYHGVAFFFGGERH